MRCPYCFKNETNVLDSRTTSGADAIRRRRECEACSKRFTTYERVEMLGISVLKRDGSTEPFAREKVLKGMIMACEKRKIKHEQIESAVDKIESYLRSQSKTEIRSNVIGQLVMKELSALDEVAYVRFASVYKKFKDTSQFMHEITLLKKMPPKAKAKV